MTPDDKIADLSAKLTAAEAEKADLLEKLQAAKKELRRLKGERDQRRITEIRKGLN